MQEYRAETYRQLQMNNLLDFIDVSFFALISNFILLSFKLILKNLEQNKTIRSLLKKSNHDNLIDDNSSDINDNKSVKEVFFI